MVVHLKFPRRYCPFCKEAHPDHLPGLSLRYRVSRRLVEYVYERFGVRQTDVWLAYETGLDLATVRKIRMDWERKMERERELTCPEFLGIDEIYLDSPKKTIEMEPQNANPAKKPSREKIPGRKPSCIITDIGTGRVLEFMPTIKMQKVKKFLASLDKRERLQAVAMNLTGHFENIVRDSFPGTPIVRDKAHVLKEAREQFSKVRNRIVNAYVNESEKCVCDRMTMTVSDEILKELVKRERDTRSGVKSDIKNVFPLLCLAKEQAPKEIDRGVSKDLSHDPAIGEIVFIPARALLAL